MKLGIGISVDVVKLQKELFHAGKNGAKYVNLQTFIDTEEQDQYGNNGGVKQTTQDMTKEQKQQQPFVGNVKVFYKSDSQPQQAGGFQPQQPAQGGFQPQPQAVTQMAQQQTIQKRIVTPADTVDFDDDLPF